MASAAPEVTAFVRWLYEQSGQPSQRQFAISAGVLDTSLTSWMRGDGLNAGNLLKLMKAAGVLHRCGFTDGQVEQVATARRAAPAAQDAPGRRPGELEAAVELLAERVEEILPLLRQALATRPPADQDVRPDAAVN